MKINQSVNNDADGAGPSTQNEETLNEINIGLDKQIFSA